MMLVKGVIVAVEVITTTLACCCTNWLAHIHNTIHLLLYNFTNDGVIFVYGANI